MAMGSAGRPGWHAETRTHQAERAAPSDPDPKWDSDYEEVSLVDIVRVLHRRRMVVGAVIVLSLLAGGAITFFAVPDYEATASMIPLEHEEIISSWLSSRQSASFATTAVAGSLYATLFPNDWDATTGTWIGAPRDLENVALAVSNRVVIGSTSEDRSLTITVTMPDPLVARDVAQAYLDGLEALRPELENLTKSQLFDKYYDGTNSQEAQRRAETAAVEKAYWLVFDSPTIPSSPVRPRPSLNMAVAGTLGIMGGVFIAFGLDWFDKYRVDITKPPR